jgi:hypothetical protein
MKKLLASIALAAVIAGPAIAQTADRPAAKLENPTAVPGGGAFGPSPRDPGAIMDSGRVIGRDPDPWIRNEIMRHSHSGWPD